MESFSDYIVDGKAIRHNLREYKKIDKKSKICAVVKADGYGIGAKNVVCAIDKNVDFYAVACFKEAESLRQFSQKPILVLNFVRPECFEKCTKKNISISVSSLAEIKKLKFANLKDKLKIHLAINTGMNRIGFSSLLEFEKALKCLNKHDVNLQVEGIFTHLYNAESVKNSKKQICIFMQYLKVLSKYYDMSKIIKHVCASGGAVKYPEFRFDMVRLGILLYGDLNFQNSKLRSVLEIKTKVTSILNIKKGESVGYGKAFVAKKDMKIATIPLGYADGIFRQYAKKGYVKINNKNCKIVGNVCMDMMMVNISSVNVKIGDLVEVIGKNLGLSEVAKNSDTISYEILTNIRKKRFNVKIL